MVAARISGVSASTFNRSNGSVLEGRTLNHRIVELYRQAVEPVLAAVAERRGDLLDLGERVVDAGIDLSGGEVSPERLPGAATGAGRTSRARPGS